MTAADAVASLRPQPSGLPLRGRASLRDGIRSERLGAAHDTRNEGARIPS